MANHFTDKTGPCLHGPTDNRHTLVCARFWLSKQTVVTYGKSFHRQNWSLPSWPHRQQTHSSLRTILAKQTNSSHVWQIISQTKLVPAFMAPQTTDTL